MLSHDALSIDKDLEGYWSLLEKFRHKLFRGVNINAYHYKLIVVIFPVQGIQRRNFFPALVAPRCPKVEKYHFALQLMQVDNIAIQIGETAVRCF